jgi:hypothetical protein
MKSKTNEIFATLSFREAVCLDKINPNTLIKEMVKSGQESIMMKGHLLDQFDDGISIYFDNEIKSLIISYLELEKIKDNTVYVHGEYLNSGLFGFTANRGETGVDMNIRYCPELNIVNLVEKKYTYLLKNIYGGGEVLHSLSILLLIHWD